MLVKEFLNKSDIESYKVFMAGYDNIEYQKSFSSWSGKQRPRYTNGLVSTYDMLTELADASVEVVNDFGNFLEEFGSLEVVDEKADNTYNYSGYLDHYLNFTILELENDQVLVSLAVGTGLDPRYGYTKNVLMIFDDEYIFIDTLSQNFGLLDFDVRDGEKTFSASFDAGALSEGGLLSLFDNETMEEIFSDEVLMDPRDLEDIQITVSEMLKSKVSIANVCYYWDAL